MTQRHQQHSLPTLHAYKNPVTTSPSRSAPLPGGFEVSQWSLAWAAKTSWACWMSARIAVRPYGLRCWARVTPGGIGCCGAKRVDAGQGGHVRDGKRGAKTREERAAARRREEERRKDVSGQCARGATEGQAAGPQERTQRRWQVAIWRGIKDRDEAVLDEVLLEGRVREEVEVKLEGGRARRGMRQQGQPEGLRERRGLQNDRGARGQ